MHPNHIVLSHLSKDHNSPALACECIGTALAECHFTGNLMSAGRDVRTPFIEC